VVVQAEGDRRYLATAASGAGSYIERRQEFADTDITFSYRFASFALDTQEIRFHSRFAGQNSHCGLNITLNQLKLVNMYVDSSGQAQSVPVTADFYSEPGVWYKVFMRTLGENMYVWVQREDEATEEGGLSQAEQSGDGTVPAFVHSQPPVLTNGATDIGTTATSLFRINLIPWGYTNTGALQVADIQVNA